MEKIFNRCIIGLLINLLLFACVENRETVSDVEVLPLASCVDKKEYHVAKLSDYAKSIQYIPLETNDQALLGGIYEKKSYFGNGNFYILADNKIYKFSDSGKYISRIGTIGNGPGEYVIIEDVDVDFHANKLYLKNNKIELLEYTTEGDFNRSIPIKQNLLEKKYFTWRFKFLSPSLFFFELTSPVDNQYIAMFSDDLFEHTTFVKASDQVIPMKGVVTIETDSEIYNSQNDYYYYKVRTDTIYRINIDSLNLEPSYVFDYGPYKMSIDDTEMIAQNWKYIKLMDIKDSGSYIFMDFLFNDYAPEPFKIKINRFGVEKEVTVTKVYAIYDKKSRTLKLLKQPIRKQLGLLNDLDGGITFWPDMISSDGKSMLKICPAETFIDTYSGKENLSEEVKAILGQINEDSNPVIIKADFK